MTWLGRFDSVSNQERIKRKIKRQIFFARLPFEIDYAVDMAADIIDLQAEREKRRPKIEEELQGDSRLGGSISVHSPWRKDDENPDPPTAA